MTHAKPHARHVIRDLARVGADELHHTHKKAGLALLAVGEAVTALAKRDRHFDHDLHAEILGGGGESILAIARRGSQSRKPAKKRPAKKAAPKKKPAKKKAAPKKKPAKKRAK